MSAKQIDENGTRGRRAAIKRLISNEKIRTQNDLSARLQKAGFKATQATVSRDIRELGLVKIVDRMGKGYYTLPETHDRLQATDQLKTLYNGSVLKAQRAMNQVVIHTAAGLAQGVCAVIDRLGWDGVLGTIAGDDTILLIAADEVIAARVMEVLEGI